MSTGTTDKQEALQDLLSDLQHTAYRELLNHEDASRIAENAFQAETDGLCYQCGGRFDRDEFSMLRDNGMIVENLCQVCGLKEANR